MMGVIYGSLGNESASMDCYLEVLECSKKHGISSVLALAYNNIGSRYQEIQQHQKAIGYFEKSADELEKVTDTENENFQIRYLITHMNLMKSYGELDRLDDACEELHKLEKCSKSMINEMYRYSYLTLKSRLYWCIGKKEYVYENLDELIKGGIDDSNAADYIEDMSDLCGLLDIDCFKQHNDTYGHIHGDRCLKNVADVLKKSVEKNGKAYRFGGDEFVLLIQNGEEETITDIAENIKKELQQLHIEDSDSGRQTTVTISQGYARFLPSRQENRYSLIEHADKALYEVKENGRDGFRIIVE